MDAATKGKKVKQIVIEHPVFTVVEREGILHVEQSLDARSAPIIIDTTGIQNVTMLRFNWKTKKLVIAGY